MNTTSLRFILILTLVSAAVLMACGPAAKQTSQAEKDATPKEEQGSGIQKAGQWISMWAKEKPKPGGILVRAQGNTAPSLDTIAEGTIGTHMVSMLPYNTLLEYQYDEIDPLGFPSKIVPALAERWEQSKDGLTYTFFLRKGVKFHDGREFTSGDAKYSVQRIIDPPPKMPSLRQGWYLGVVDKMETPDPYTFLIKLNDIDAAFIQKIAAGYTPMVPKHLLEPFNARVGTNDMDKGNRHWSVQAGQGG